MASAPEARLTLSSKLALDWATYFAATRAGTKSPTIDSVDLLMGLLFAHPKDSEPLQLLDHFKIPGNWLQAALSVDRRLNAKSLPLAPPSLDAAIGEDAEALIRSAEELARQANADEGLARNRDLFGAMLQTYGSPAGRLLEGLLERRLASTRIEQLAGEYPRYLSGSPHETYRQFLEQHHPWKPRTPSIPSYDADAVGSAARARDGSTTAPQDLVGIGPEVDAFAYLVAARALVPPLAIGLFGDWGSGKSFFMQALRRRVDRVTDEARRSGRPQRDLPIHKSVVQIEFNAWHYVEGNLWASLVEHIFSNLRTAEGERPDLVDERRQHVMKEIKSTRIARIRVRCDIRAEQRRLGQAKQAREALEKQRTALLADSKGKVDAARIVLMTAYTDEETGRLFAQLGLDSTVKSVADFFAATADARLVLRRGSGLFGRLQAGGWRWTAAVVAVVAVGPLVSLVLAQLGTAASTNVLASIGAVAAGGTALLRSGTQWTSAQLAKVEGAERAVRAAQQEVDEALAEADRQLETIQAKLADKVQEEEVLTGRISDLTAQLAGITPARVLSDFIDARVGSDDYRKHLGLTALVRRDFEDLWGLIRKENDEFVRTDDGTNTGPRREVSRIVLYIDDLDRCPPRVVVNVLQAVHLLLAFPLFVVVVAVDARWLANSLQKHYGELLGRPRFGPYAPESDGDQASPEDYLEKIFQVPFWVRPLDSVGRERIIQGLVAPSVAWDTDTGPVGPSEQLAQPSGENEEHVAVLIQRLFAPEDDPPDLDPQGLQIRPRELRFMAALAPILGNSPRAVKRFVNVYRLMKSLAEGMDAEFTADTPFPGSKRVLFLLAVVTGLPALSPMVFERVEHPDPTQATLGLLAEALVATTSDPGSTQHDEAVLLRDWVVQTEGGAWSSLNVSELVRWTDDIARFAFRSEVN